MLLVGKGKIIIDDFFYHLSEHFEMQNASTRYDDLISHIRYFVPDLIVYCLFKESKESLAEFARIREQTDMLGIPVVIIGNPDECEEFQSVTVRMAAKEFRKPITILNIKAGLLQFMQKRGPAQKKTHSGSPENVSDAEFMRDFLDREEAGDFDMPVMPKSFTDAHPLPAPPPPPSFITGATADAPQPKSAPSFTQTTAADAPQPKSVPSFTHSAAADAPQPKSAPSFTQTAAADAPQPKSVPSFTHSAAADAPPRKHVLVVDDDPMLLKLIKEQLKDTYAVGTAISGKIALKFLEHKTTDLIILDYKMPEMDGAQFLKQIRATKGLENLPVIFLTGVTDKEKIKEVVGLKPQGYLLKPIDRKQLLEIISRVIG